MMASDVAVRSYPSIRRASIPDEEQAVLVFDVEEPPARALTDCTVRGNGDARPVRPRNGPP
jgi:hypothetical protein